MFCFFALPRNATRLQMEHAHFISNVTRAERLWVRTRVDAAVCVRAFQMCARKTSHTAATLPPIIPNIFYARLVPLFKQNNNKGAFL